MALGPSEIVQQSTVVELVISRLNLLCLVHNKDGNPPDRQRAKVDLVPPSDYCAGIVDIERCHTWEWRFQDLLIDEHLS
jgi:hypothetical protein